MATLKTDIFTSREQASYKLHELPSYRNAQAPVKVVCASYTLVGTEANADVLKLEMPRIEGYLRPENSRVINIGGSDADLDLKLQRLGAESGASAEDLTTAASIDNNSVAFARPTGGVPNLLRADTLQAVLSNVEAVTAGEVLLFELEFYTPEGS